MPTTTVTAEADDFRGNPANTGLSYAGAPGPVTVNANLGLGFFNASGWAAGDLYDANISTITLTSGDDIFVTIGGNTTVYGGAGNDFFIADYTAFNYHGETQGIGTAAVTPNTIGDGISFALIGYNGTAWRVEASTDGSIRNYAVGLNSTNWQTLAGSWDDMETLEGGPLDDILHSIGGDGRSHQLIGDSTIGPNTGVGSGDIFYGSMLISELNTMITGGSIPLSDSFIPGAGADTIYLGYRLNWIDYETDTTGITVSIGSTGSGGEAQGDQYIAPTGRNISTMAINLVGGRNSDVLTGNDGDNLIWGGGPPAGSLNNNYEDYGSDTIHGQGGNDNLWGFAGNDALFGDADADLLAGGEGRDTLSGGAGADSFIYQFLSDSYAGTASGRDDVITDYSYAEGDTIDLTFMGANSYSIQYQNSVTSYVFSTANGQGDYLQIGVTGLVQGASLLMAAGSNLTIVGSGAQDVIIGSAHNDRILGGDGADWMSGGSGGADEYVYNAASQSTLSNPDLIFEFHQNEDKIDLRGFGLSTSNVNWIVQDGASYVFVDSDKNGSNDMCFVLDSYTAISFNDLWL